MTTSAPSELATGPLPVSASTEAPARMSGYAYASVDLKSGSERSVIVVPSPVAARILVGGGLGGGEAAIRMNGRRLVQQVEADQEGQADHDDGGSDRDRPADACRGIRSVVGRVAVETEWPRSTRPNRHNAPAPRPTSVKTIGSAKAW